MQQGSTASICCPPETRGGPDRCVVPGEALMGGAVSLVEHLCVSWGDRSKSSIPAHSHTCRTWLLAGATLRGEEECWVSITGHSSSHTHTQTSCVLPLCARVSCVYLTGNYLSTRSELAVDSCFGIFSIFRLELWLIKDFPIQYEVKDPEDSCYISIYDKWCEITVNKINWLCVKGFEVCH